MSILVITVNWFSGYRSIAKNLVPTELADLLELAGGEQYGTRKRGLPVSR